MAWASVAAGTERFRRLGIGRHMPTAAQTSTGLPPNVGSGDRRPRSVRRSSRSSSTGAAAKGAAIRARLRFAKGVRYSENSVPLPIPDGFWKNASGARPYRLYIADPDWGTIGFYSRMYENGTPVIVSTRLRCLQPSASSPKSKTIVTSERGRTPDL